MGSGAVPRNPKNMLNIQLKVTNSVYREKIFSVGLSEGDMSPSPFHMPLNATYQQKLLSGDLPHTSGIHFQDINIQPFCP